jgi:hypothetical protein
MSSSHATFPLLQPNHMFVVEGWTKYHFEPMYIWVVQVGESMYGHGFGHYKGWTNIFQPCFHENQDFKLLNYPPRPCCKDVFVHTFYSLEIIPFYIAIREWNVNQTQCEVEFELQCGYVTIFTKVASYMHYNGLLVEAKFCSFIPKMYHDIYKLVQWKKIGFWWCMCFIFHICCESTFGLLVVRCEDLTFIYEFKNIQFSISLVHVV